MSSKLTKRHKLGCINPAGVLSYIRWSWLRLVAVGQLPLWFSSVISFCTDRVDLIWMPRHLHPNLGASQADFWCGYTELPNTRGRVLMGIHQDRRGGDRLATTATLQKNEYIAERQERTCPASTQPCATASTTCCSALSLSALSLSMCFSLGWGGWGLGGRRTDRKCKIPSTEIREKALPGPRSPRKVDAVLAVHHHFLHYIHQTSLK